MGGAVRVGRRLKLEVRWDQSHLIPLSSHQAPKNYFAYILRQNIGTFIWSNPQPICIWASKVTQDWKGQKRSITEIPKKRTYFLAFKPISRERLYYLDNTKGMGAHRQKQTLQLILDWIGLGAGLVEYITWFIKNFALWDGCSDWK